jgi:hypothetical protein
MDNDQFDNPETWRKRASEARARAERLHDRSSREMLLEIAERYDRLAERAERYGGAGTLAQSR